MTGQPSTRTAQYPVEIVALANTVLGWDLSTRDRQEPPSETVEAAITQLTQHAVALRDDLAAHIWALPPDDAIRRRAVVTQGEADRRLKAAARRDALRAQNLARLVRALSTVGAEAERRIHDRLAARAIARDAAPAADRGWP
ncbi:hypothetical protein [Streptomyces sp. NPDC054887]